MLVTVSAKNIEGESKSPWYETPYNVEKISSELVHKLNSPVTNNMLMVPDKNIFIPEQTNLLAITDNLKPELLTKSKGMEIWYSADTSFGTPKANLFVTIRSPATMRSAGTLNLTELMVSLFKDSLNEFSYPAYLAGLHYELYNHSRGVTIKISGYNDKQSELLNKILLTFKYKAFNAERFDIIKERLMRKLLNAKDRKPYEQAISETQTLILSPSWREEDRLEVLSSQNLNDLENFRSEFFSTLDTAILSTGNVSRAGTLNIGKQLESIILSSSMTQRVERPKVLKLSGSQTYYSTRPVEHPDTGFVYYLQGNNKTYKQRAMFQLLSQILSTNYYARIRTDKQLGYIVFATNFTLLETPALAFIVQSPISDGPTLYEETELFLSSQVSILADLEPSKFKQYQQAVVSQLLKKENTLYQKSNRYWQEIDIENSDFDSRERLSNTVNKITREELHQFYTSLIKSKGNALVIYTENLVDGEKDNYSEKLMRLTDAPEQSSHYFNDTE